MAPFAPGNGASPAAHNSETSRTSTKQRERVLWLFPPEFR